MKLIFVSNFLNHYQKALAEEFIKFYGDGYKFIAMTPFDVQRLNIGFKDENQAPYVIRAYESSEAMQEAMKLIDESECVIVGGVPVNVVAERLKQGKITFMYSERFFKGPVMKDIVRFFKYCLYSGGRTQARDIHSKFYLLCAGAFAAWDYNTCGLFRGKAYRWGYFPDIKHYDDIDGLISRKKKHSILWAGRFLDWKHPDIAVMLAKNLKASGLEFSMKIIGSGEMRDSLAGMIEAMNLRDCVELTDSLPTEELRKEMERTQIFLFTSDRGEGWGVVLNEAMNSGCTVAASDRIGSVPYLVRDGYNGLIFRDRDIDGLTQKVSDLLKDSEKTAELGREAYNTMCGVWNAQEAAKRFVVLADALSSSDEPVRLWEDGPCSIAPVI